MLSQLLLAAAAAAVLGDVDLSFRGTDVDEVAQVADALGGRRVGRAVGQGDAESAGAAEDRRVADVEPGHALRWWWRRSGRPTELMTMSWPLTGLTAKLAPPVNGHCGSGVGSPSLGLEQAVGPADAVDLEEVGIVAAAAGPEVLVERAVALLVGGHAGGVAAGPVPDDVAVADDVGV